MNPSNTPLVQSDTLRGALLARLAMEARHTLHQVLGSLELVAEESLSRAQTNHLGRCRESAHELLRVVNDVSELADSGTCAEKPSRFDFSELLQEFSSLIGIRAARKGLDLRWTVDRHVPQVVLGCRQTIEKVLYRLVDNSIKFTELGGIVIKVKPKYLDQPSGEMVIEVGDTGPGIAPDALGDIPGEWSGSLNSGLGLRLARKQLAEIGGHLEIVSSSPQGATLAIVCTVTVPSTSNGDLALQDHHNGALGLLVAEDSDDSFAVFASFVKGEGHHITRAVNGAEALEMFKTGTYDMVVMDVNMPVMDGYTATRAIRDWETQQGRARLPILLLSADDARRQARIGAAAGCSGYLTKPTPKRELLCALRHYSRAT